MASYSSPQVRSFVRTLRNVVGVDLGNVEWTAIQSIVEGLTESSLSKSLASTDDVLISGSRFADAFALLPPQEEFLFDSIRAVDCRWNRGTLDCIDFISSYGAVPTLNAVSLVTGYPLVRDFLGRLLTLDGSWLIEKHPNNSFGKLAGWRVSQPRNPQAGVVIFPTQRECREYVESQPTRRFLGSRRIDEITEVRSLTCPLGHICNYFGEELTECPTCRYHMGDISTVSYDSLHSYTRVEVEIFLDNQIES
jgi:hypothetical protein